jgi:spore coat protein U-like protein
MLLKPIIKLLIASAIFTYIGGVFAFTTATFEVTSTVTSNCTISATPMAFGNYDPVGVNALTDLIQTSTVSVTCTKGVNSATVGMDYGLHVTGTTQRQMIGAVATDLLSYNLFQPPSFGGACPGTVAFNNTTPMAIPLSTSKTARSFNVCGTVPANQDATIGTYTDTVTVSINF